VVAVGHACAWTAWSVPGLTPRNRPARRLRCVLLRLPRGVLARQRQPVPTPRWRARLRPHGDPAVAPRWPHGDPAVAPRWPVGGPAVAPRCPLGVRCL